MNFIPLPESFYEPSAKVVAPQLLGHWLVRKTEKGFCGGPIVETEAYLCDDPACHSFVGKTARNRVMWEHFGYSYVYLIYGLHFCVNAVCRPAGIAEAVLIRAVEPTIGIKLMQQNRVVSNLHQLTNGPAKLCNAMDIDRKLDGINLCDAKSPLFIAQNPEIDLFRQERGALIETTRIGITKAAELPLRFYLENSPFVSKRLGSKRKTI